VLICFRGDERQQMARQRVPMSFDVAIPRSPRGSNAEEL
jgi:hypothetical protein